MPARSQSIAGFQSALKIENTEAIKPPRETLEAERDFRKRKRRSIATGCRTALPMGRAPNGRRHAKSRRFRPRVVSPSATMNGDQAHCPRPAGQRMIDTGQAFDSTP